MAGEALALSPRLPVAPMPGHAPVGAVAETGAASETPGRRGVAGRLAGTAGPAGKAVLLLAVLGLHFAERLHTALSEPLPSRGTFTYVYSAAFALMSGQGFQLIGFPSVPEAIPLTEFLALQRERVTGEEFQACFTHPQARPAPGLSPWPANFHTTRVLDIYAAALLWKTFGISWTVYFVAYALVSTLAGFLLFCIGRRLGGSYWPGLFAAILFLAAPLENDFASRSVRDISPLWFAILGFFVLACVVDAFRARSLNLASFLLLGITAAAGYGWRSDALILVPFLLIALIVYLGHRGRSWGYLAGAAVLFVIGTAGTLGLLQTLCPVPRQSSQVGFHIAYYGEYSRRNLLGLEHSLQIPRDDVQTDFNRATYFAAHHPGTPLPAPLSPEYGATCRQMYLEALQYNGFHWISRLPRLFYLAVQATRGQHMPVLAWSMGNHDLRHLGPAPGYASVLDTLARVSPWLFLTGLAPVLCCCRHRILTGSLVAFSLGYCGVLVVVLPEFKHAGLLLLPVTVIGALGTWTLLRLARPAQWCAELARVSWPGARSAVVLLAGSSLLWGGACALTHASSVAMRAGYLRDIMALAGNGTPVPEAIQSPQRFAVSTVPDQPSADVGYLLTIRAGERPGQLLCKHLYHWPTNPAFDRTFCTRHQLHPNRLQYFFVSTLTHNDFRGHWCTVTLDRDAVLLAAVRVDMAHWRRLTVSTVFYEGERTAGSPRVKGSRPSGVMEYAIAPVDAATLVAP